MKRGRLAGLHLSILGENYAPIQKEAVNGIKIFQAVEAPPSTLRGIAPL